MSLADTLLEIRDTIPYVTEDQGRHREALHQAFLLINELEKSYGTTN